MEKPESHNWRLEPTGPANTGKTRAFMGTGPGLACQDAAGPVFGEIWNRTEQF